MLRHNYAVLSYLKENREKKELDAFLHDSVFLLPTALSLAKLIVCSVVVLNLERSHSKSCLFCTSVAAFLSPLELHRT